MKLSFYKYPNTTKILMSFFFFKGITVLIYLINNSDQYHQKKKKKFPHFLVLTINQSCFVKLSKKKKTFFFSVFRNRITVNLVVVKLGR